MRIAIIDVTGTQVSTVMQSALGSDAHKLSADTVYQASGNCMVVIILNDATAAKLVISE